MVFSDELGSDSLLLCSIPLFLEGRRKPVTWLQRHPLIYPIFLPHPSPKGEGEKVISVPFARENLFLVISCNFIETQPLYLQYSIFIPTL